MVEISFRREIPEDKYNMIHAAMLMQEKSFDEYAWEAILAAVNDDILQLTRKENTSCSEVHKDV